MRAAVLDACVLYPAPLRDFFLRLIQGGVIEGYWTATILDECFRSVARDRPDLAPAQLQRSRGAMESYFPDRLLTGHEHLIEGLDLPDLDDRHVVAAAISGEVPVIVTFNLRDFLASRLGPLGIVAVHPDTFVLAAVARDPDGVLAVLHGQVASLRNPPTTLTELLDGLALQGLREAMAAMRGRAS